MNKLLKPPGNAARFADGFIVCVTGIACFFAYYLIKFDLCIKYNCDELVYTKLWASLPELFILYGLAILLVGIFLIREKEIIRIYRLGIVITVLTGFMLSAIVVFGMGAEIGKTT